MKGPRVHNRTRETGTESIPFVARRTTVRVADRPYAVNRGEIIFQGGPQSGVHDEELMKTIGG
jgi:ABC-type lipopolysaccharide export system ATPase subunit